MNATLKITVVIAMIMTFSSCGWKHSMEDDGRLKPLEEDTFFNNESSSQLLVKHTVARGHLKDDSPFYTGIEGGDYLKYSPIPITRKDLERGQDRFNIYCAVCHSRTGDGNGMIVQRGFTRPPTFHNDRLRQMPVGYFFRVMTEGSRKMPRFSDVLDENDRWKVAVYIHALQRSRNAELKVVPDVVKTKLNKQDEDITDPVYESEELHPEPNGHH